MRFGINLRGDLAKLDDAEIAARYEKLIAEKERRIQTLPSSLKYRVFRWLFVEQPGRGLLHGRIFYKFYAQLFRLAIALGAQDWVRDEAVEHYYSECEFKDVRDEIKRRVRWRKLSVAGS
ncbi:hypothetical protein [Tardiphaga sp. 709]|uniref:hypothetical protein n=1 Tax=Tardiphaga sp. 709 TaxID=3076039 RepID=UPI0028E93B04|nr:hypothetical protein [Tardiphaga sp. 709]WNV09298.1 hypothetical protein RSO67_28185 [Tardiphaga sp. 709]